MRRFLAATALSFALVLPALPGWAGEAAPAKTAAKSAAAPGSSVEMPILVAPMVVDGRLTAYAYISSTILAASPDAAIDVRAKTAFLQDAFLRDVNAAPIVDPNGPDKVDSATLKTRLLADARQIVGAGKVAGLDFTQLQVTPLRP